MFARRKQEHGGWYEKSERRRYDKDDDDSNFAKPAPRRRDRDRDRDYDRDRDRDRDYRGRGSDRDRYDDRRDRDRGATGSTRASTNDSGGKGKGKSSRPVFFKGNKKAGGDSSQKQIEEEAPKTVEDDYRDITDSLMEEDSMAGTHSISIQKTIKSD